MRIEDIRNTIIQGDTLEVLKEMPDGCVDCIITSPAYWGLRNYGVEGQLGLEPTIEEHIANMMAIMTECKRVLADYGTLWLNYGDSYAGSVGFGSGKVPTKSLEKKRYEAGAEPIERPNKTASVKRKSMCMVPERLAIAMVDDGWVLRNKIIWHKPSVMPQSAKDRLTNDWEYIYFFSKKPKGYYFEQQFEESKTTGNGDWPKTGGEKYKDFPTNSGKKIKATPMRNCRAVWKIASQAVKEAHFATFPFKLIERPIIAGCPELVCTGKKSPVKKVKIYEDVGINECPKCGKEKREKNDVCYDCSEEIAKEKGKEYKTRHKARDQHWEKKDIIGEILIDGCGKPVKKVIEKEGTLVRPKHAQDYIKKAKEHESKRGFREHAEYRISNETLIDGCGKPVIPEIETDYIKNPIDEKVNSDERKNKGMKSDNMVSFTHGTFIANRKPTTTATHCSCGAPFRRGRVLDLFMGSGTTAIVARALDRDYIGIELNPKYIEIAKRRLEKWPKELVLEKLANGNGRVRAVEEEEATGTQTTFSWLEEIEVPTQ